MQGTSLKRHTFLHWTSLRRRTFTHWKWHILAVDLVEKWHIHVVDLVEKTYFYALDLSKKYIHALDSTEKRALISKRCFTKAQIVDKKLSDWLSLSSLWCVKESLPRKSEYVWWTGRTPERDGWKSWSTERGAQSVMIAGTSRMHESFVVSSDTTRELRDFVPMIQTSEARSDVYMLVSHVTIVLFCVSIEIS